MSDLAPQPADAAAERGLLLEAEGRLDAAEAAYREGLAQSPRDMRLTRLLGVLLLRLGRYAEGLPLHEARAAARPTLSFPEWTGQAIRSLLIIPEGGPAEQIQYARFAARVGRRGRVTLICHPRLARLFDALGLGLLPADVRLQAPPHDAWVLAGSLPHRLGLTLEGLPAAPYLPRRAGGRGVGFVGRADPGAGETAVLPPDLAAEIERLPGVTRLDAESGDFADIAAQIDRLELVISVESAVAHLAGAMGKPCWLLLPHRADWRWLEARADSPWYPSMRLFRQAMPGDWASVVAEVRRALEAGER